MSPTCTTPRRRRELAAALCRTQLRGPGLLLQLGRRGERGRTQVRRKWAHDLLIDYFGPEKHAIVAFTNAFHGRTFGALAATPREKYQAPFRPLLPGVRFAQFNDLAGAAEVIGDDVCAVIVEPVQGEGGVHPATRSSCRGCGRCATGTTRC